MTDAETPRPMPFALMRNAHEALRASIHQMEAQAAAGELAALRAEWGDFRRALAVHMALEDQFMFALLDQVSSGAVAGAGLPAEHHEDVRLEAALDAALAATPVQLDAVRAAFRAWRDSHLMHLLHEEEIMMPLVQKTAPTPDGRARVVHDRLVTPGERLADFDWFIGWVIRTLAAHGSTGQPPAVAVRVFAWGLQHACDPAQWARLSKVVRDNCTPVIWDEMVRGFALDGPGRIAD